MYSFYKDEYLLGREEVIDVASFPFYERQARKEIERYTLGKTSEEEEFKMCICEVAERLFIAEENTATTQGIASEKTGDHSISYVNVTDINVSRANEIKQVVHKWLANTGLLYRGC